MKKKRWLDHLPPWLSLGALATSGLFTPAELAIMGTPLVLAACVDWSGWNMARWRRGLEFGALGALLVMGAAHVGLLLAMAYLLFILCGVRLALPRSLSQRRQILLMGFLLFLMAAMSLPSVDFALWALLWVASGALALLYQAWEGQGGSPPLRQLLPWSLGVCLIAGACFLGLPRLDSEVRSFGWGIRGVGQAVGLAESLDLADRGPLREHGTVALRIVPPGNTPAPQREQLAQRLSLLKGVNLESLDGMRWETSPHTPDRPRVRFLKLPDLGAPDGGSLDFQLAPTSDGLVPLPYGTLTLSAFRGWPLGPHPGGGIRWQFPPRRMVPVEVTLEDNHVEGEALSLERRLLLTQTGEGTESALRWSRRIAPEELPAPALAEKLSAAMRTYRYTLANPSGRAPNPLEDFLERSRAGHCEYFASALACALRYRKVPARVAVGYRLGPWIPEGGYWLVTQNEAHSWVEYYDAPAHCWRVADPTPAALEPGRPGFLARLSHWQDALSFRWDRYVLRFSDRDQAKGLDGLQNAISLLRAWRPSLHPLALLLLAGGALCLGAWGIARRLAPPRPWGGLRALNPLLRKARREVPPALGETARTWLVRLSGHAPGLREMILELADMADACAYGNGDPQALRALAKVVAKKFTHSSQGPMNSRGAR